MAIRDHTAPARLSVPLGKAFSDPSGADPQASASPTHSLRLSTLDDVALALYSLAVMCIEDERCRSAQATVVPTAEPATFPLPPLFREGLVVAIQCLENYAEQLGPRQAMNA